MKYKLVVFDLDGTILNTIDDLTNASNYVNRKYGYEEHTVQQVKYFVGNGIPKLIERSIPAGTSPQQQKKVLEDFISYYNEHCADLTAPYPGIPECIKQLKAAGVKLAVNTNKVDGAAVELCKKYFPDCFDFVAGARPGIPVKPDPQGVNEILKITGISGDQACYIGDSDVDIQTGLNAGMDSIGVDWGFRGRNFLIEHGAKIVAMTPAELTTLLLK